VVVDRTADGYGWLEEPTLNIAIRSGTFTYDVTAIYGCPNCAQQYAVPTMPQDNSGSNYNYSRNYTYVNTLNASVTIQSLFKDTTNISITVTEPDFSFLQPPTWDWSLFGVKFSPHIRPVAVALDSVMIAYRTTLTVSMVLKFVRGVDKHIPATLLGKQADLRWMLEVLFCGYLFGLIRWFAKKIKRLDHTLWILFGKMLFLMQVTALLMVVIIAYWVVDNAIKLDTFDQLGVFSAMTAAPATQKTLRNEQLVTKAVAYNKVAEAQFATAIIEESTSIFKRQSEFNKGEYQRVSTFNEEYCQSLSTALLYPFTLEAQSATDLPYQVSPLSTLYFTLDASEQDGVSNYVIDKIDLSFSWAPTVSPISNSSGYESCFDRSVYTDLKALGLTITLLETINGTTTPAAVYTDTSSWNPVPNTPSACTPQSYYISSQFSTVSFSPSAADSVYASKLAMEFTMNSLAFSGYTLTAVSVVGHLSSEDQINCNELGVKWHELDFQPSNYTQNCSSVVPVSAYAMRLYDRDSWTTALREAHRPFIDAMRNIALSPFYLVTVALVVLVVVLLFLGLLEWFMVKVDLIRENTFALVPCVIADRSQVRMSKLESQGKVVDDEKEIGTDHENSTNSAKSDQHAKPALSLPASEPKKKQTGKPKKVEIEIGTLTSASSVVQAPKAVSPTFLIPSNSPNIAPANPVSAVSSPTPPPAATTTDHSAWVKVKDADGKEYYYHPTTRETSWDPPKA